MKHQYVVITELRENSDKNNGIQNKNDKLMW
jgi:hypothetical protein